MPVLHSLAHQLSHSVPPTVMSNSMDHSARRVPRSNDFVDQKTKQKKQSKAKQSEARNNTAKQNKAKQSKAKQSQAKQNKAKRNVTSLAWEQFWFIDHICRFSLSAPAYGAARRMAQSQQSCTACFAFRWCCSALIPSRWC